MGVFGSFCEFLGVFVNFWEFLGICGSFWEFLGSCWDFGSFWGRSSRAVFRRVAFRFSSCRSSRAVFRRVVRRVPPKLTHHVIVSPGKLRNASRQTPRRTPVGVARAGPLS